MCDILSVTGTHYKMISGIRAALLLLAASSWAAEPRAPAVAGRFYPADPKELASVVDAHMEAAGKTNVPGRVVAVLAPHAGLVYSGALAAKALSAARGLDPDVVVVLGTGHTKPLEGAALYPGDYATPEGVFRYDAALAKKLFSLSGRIKADAGAHKREHSIEVVLPYIRRVAPKARLVALVLNTQSLEPAREVGRAVAEALEGRKALIVVSADLSHYPPQDVAEAVDGATLEAAAGLDPALFWLANRLLLTRGLKTLAVAWCGEAAMTAALEAAARLGARSLRVLARSDSSQTARDDTRVVGYAAAAFTTAEPLLPPHSQAERAELLKLARASIEAWLKTGKRKIGDLHRMARLNAPAAVFVSLKDAKGALRGCIGGLRPEAPLHEAVTRAAVSAAVEDPRFKPVTAEELPKLTVEVSILSPRRRASAEDVEPGDGVVVERDGRSGVFLPEVWEQIPGKEEFLGELCSQKAGLERDCWKDSRTRLFAFETERIN